MLSCFSRDTSRRSLNSASPCVGIVCPDTGDSTASANNTSNISTNVGTFQTGYTSLRFELQKPEGNYRIHRTAVTASQKTHLPCQVPDLLEYCLLSEEQHPVRKTPQTREEMYVYTKHRGAFVSNCYRGEATRITYSQCVCSFGYPACKTVYAPYYIYTCGLFG